MSAVNHAGGETPNSNELLTLPALPWSRYARLALAALEESYRVNKAGGLLVPGVAEHLFLSRSSNALQLEG